LNAHGVSDPVSNDTRGFSRIYAKLYTELVARGSASVVEHKVGAYIEDLDIVTLGEIVSVT
jgi:hypothetical protein